MASKKSTKKPSAQTKAPEDNTAEEKKSPEQSEGSADNDSSAAPENDSPNPDPVMADDTDGELPESIRKDLEELEKSKQKTEQLSKTAREKLSQGYNLSAEEAAVRLEELGERQRMLGERRKADLEEMKRIGDELRDLETDIRQKSDSEKLHENIVHLRQTQRREREKKAAIKEQLEKSGLPMAEIMEIIGGNLSALDKAMTRKNTRGGKRPEYPVKK